MGYRLEVHEEPAGHAVFLALALSREESNDLFLGGDAMVSWPTDGMTADGDAQLSRSSIFVSEIASRPHGLTLVYGTVEQAERTRLILGRQLDDIGIVREG